MLPHPTDEQSLYRLLGVTDLPESVVDEYGLRLKMFHRDGASGPLGTLALIDMLRFLKVDLPAAAPGAG